MAAYIKRFLQELDLPSLGKRKKVRITTAPSLKRLHSNL